MPLQFQGVQLFAPSVYPTARVEIRAYTIAAFRVAQNSDQLSLVPMPKPKIDFLIKGRAIGYWKEKGWLAEGAGNYHLTTVGLVVCQSALAEQLLTHNTNAASIQFWVNEFRFNSSLPRSARFGG